MANFDPDASTILEFTGQLVRMNHWSTEIEPQPIQFKGLRQRHFTAKIYLANSPQRLVLEWSYGAHPESVVEAIDNWRRRCANIDREEPHTVCWGVTADGDLVAVECETLPEPPGGWNAITLEGPDEYQNRFGAEEVRR